MPDFNILVIEDDRTLNQQLTDLLIPKGYKVEQCFAGEEGLLRASSQ
jgi:two-component system response regulator PfeR